MFAPLPDKPDHDALERAVLDRWELERTFDQLRAKNADGPRFSFIDGPVTANKSLAVHTAWGRTLKDVFQRYKALRGYHQRYQNGFDCQGLWIEVGVERELGLNSKREIEEFGLAEFARRCRAVVEKSAAELTAGSIRLGPVDGLGPRLLHVLRHEHRVHLALPGDRPGAGLALPGPPVHGVVPSLRHVDLRPRAGRQLRRPRGPVALGALPAARPPGPGDRHLDHHALDAACQRGRRRVAHRRPTAGSPTATGWPSSAARAPSRRPRAARELVGLRYEGPFDGLGPGAEAGHRVIGWDEVSLDEGTGVVHIAPGCGTEDFELSKVGGPRRAHARRRVGSLLPGVRLAGRPRRPRRRRRHHRRPPVARDLLVDAGTISHRYPSAGDATRR